MPRVVVVGGGWAGCSAALAARRAGMEAALLERTDLLLGTGLVGGIMRNNGRFTATEEALALGAGELFALTDSLARHRGLNFFGHHRASIYDVTQIEPRVAGHLRQAGVEVHLETRVVAAEVEGRRVVRVAADCGPDQERRWFGGDASVDATGSAGPQANCARWGQGCAMCVLRCPSFGGRVSLVARVGIGELCARGPGGTLGAISGSCELLRESLDPALAAELTRSGVVRVPVPPDLRRPGHLEFKACQQYALPEYGRFLVLLDNGQAKMMAPYFPLAALRRLPGLERARYLDPAAGGRGNSTRFWAIAPRDNSLRVQGTANLLCAGEKAGTLVGHTAAIVTGWLAGHNAARMALGLEPLSLPRSLAVGDLIAYSQEETRRPSALRLRYTFSGSVYLQRMRRLGLYTTDPEEVRARVRKTGLEGALGVRPSR
ncbi:MAG: FAD-dependent oxidoreductase [Acetobacteraceae bacterium]|nr:FAD-dependent oxidoreductase [Acetobacteraceae bacterium]